jgi:hypothetical protein
VRGTNRCTSNDLERETHPFSPKAKLGLPAAINLNTTETPQLG